jgi:hypothetical protein
MSAKGIIANYFIELVAVPFFAHITDHAITFSIAI